MYALKNIQKYVIIFQGGDIMTVTKAKLASNARYREKQEFIQLRVGQGERDRYKAAAAALGVSVNQLFINAVEQFIADNVDKLTENGGQSS